RQALRRQGEAVLDLERAEPAGLPETAVRPPAAHLAGDLPWPVPGRLRGPAGVGELLGHDRADGRDLAGRGAESGRAGTAGVPARHAVPELKLPPGGALRAAARRRLCTAPLRKLPGPVRER